MLYFPYFNLPATKIKLKKVIRTDEYFMKRIRERYYHLLNHVTLDSTQSELIFIQSCVGYAIDGFQETDSKEPDKKQIIYYPNTTIEDVTKAVGRHIGRDHFERETIIKDIQLYIDTAFNAVANYLNDDIKPEEHALKLVNKHNEPLSGIKFLQGSIISNPHTVLQGMYLGGCLDSSRWRTKTEKAYNIKMHKGVSMPVHLEKLIKHGSDVQSLSNVDSENHMTLEELTYHRIIPKNDRVKFSSGYHPIYVEQQKGYGVSDDAAFLAISLIYGIDAALGFLLIDAVDTWDKSVSVLQKKGHDEIMGQRIRGRFEDLYGKGEFQVSNQDVMDLIYLSAIDDKNSDCYPSCSHRRFVQMNPKTKLTAIENHIAYARHVKEGGFQPPSMKIAFKQVKSETFYKEFKKRYDKLAKGRRFRKSYELPKSDNNHE